MRSCFSTPRTALFLAAALVAGSPLACVACGNPREPLDEGALRAAFPAQAALVLEAPHPLTADEGGFTLALPADERPARLRRLSLRLPPRGSEALRFELPGGLVVRVREDGAAGEEGALAGNAVVYRREGGSAYWTATAAGYEEWLHLDADATSAAAPAVTWQIEGAQLRPSRRGVELTDERGTARLVVEAPAAYAASGRPVDVRLAARGQTLELWVDGGGEPVLADPVWYTVASMSVPRAHHTATLLQDGRVLVAGGNHQGVIHSSAEIYDPLADTWTPAGTMTAPRQNHTATLLPDGKVLVVAGTDLEQKYSELYDPATGAWTPTVVVSGPRIEHHTTTLLDNGRVLAVGGKHYESGLSLQIVHRYDPSTDVWTLHGTLATARRNHTAVLLQDGRLLVAGGYTGGPVPTGSWLASTEIYEPTTGTWSSAAPMLHARDHHAAALLPDGKVIVTGGYGPETPGVLPFTEIYDPATNTWTAKANMGAPRADHEGVVLWNDKLLVVGGQNVGSVYFDTAVLFDPAANTWSTFSALAARRASFTATRLPINAVLVAGGLNEDGGDPYGTYLASSEIYFPNAVGVACIGAVDCQSGYCADGVCCSTACDHGACGACSVAAGAAVNGTCTTFSGTACDDGDACTQTDTCQSGACVGANPIACPPPGPCQNPGTCVSATGECQYTPESNGTPCDDGSLCTSSDACQNGACTGTPVVCPSPSQCQTATACDPAAGCPPLQNKPDGAPCNDNSLCGDPDICVAGTCVGQNPVVCPPAPDQCHLPGTCLPFTGTCAIPQKPDGTTCDDGNPCTTDDACQNGSCVAGSPVQCTAPDACHLPGTCNPATGACENAPNKPDGVSCSDGNECTQADKCQAGVCTGTNKPNGTQCFDFNPCTQTDTCQSGVCTGANPIPCPAPDACHEGACNPATGACLVTPKPEGAPCDDGTACTQVDTCQAGVCTGSSPVDCPPSQSPCHVATCNPATGACGFAAKPNFSPCDDGDPCTQAGQCQLGACVSTPVTCFAPDACHQNGTCDPATGDCTYPNKPDGTTCPGGTCEDGVCTDGGTGGAGGTTTTTSTGSGAGGSGGTTTTTTTSTGTDTGTGGNGGNTTTTTATTGSGGNGGEAAGGGSGGSTTTTDTTGSGPGGGDSGSGASGANAPDASGGCGCGVVGSPGAGGLWAGLAALLALARRRSARRRSRL